MLVDADFGQVAPCYREIERCRRQTNAIALKSQSAFFTGFRGGMSGLIVLLRTSSRILQERVCVYGDIIPLVWILVAGSEKSADKTANDSCAEGCPDQAMTTYL